MLRLYRIVQSFPPEEMRRRLGYVNHVWLLTQMGEVRGVDVWKGRGVAGWGSVAL